jgi:hypothetical protein
MHLYELPFLFRQTLLLRLPALTIMQRKKQRPSSLYKKTDYCLHLQSRRKYVV